MSILKKIATYIFVIGILIGGLYFLFLKIDEKKAEERERNLKIENGECLFNKINLENLTIKYYDKSFKAVVDLDTLKHLFYDQLYKLNVQDTSSKTKSFRIDNAEFSFVQKGNLAAIKSISLDLSSSLSFLINGNVEFHPKNNLNEFKVKYPSSFSCRFHRATSWRSESFALKVENSNVDSHFQYLVFYFNSAENLFFIEFYYSFD